jgi:hypothetical protein
VGWTAGSLVGSSLGQTSVGWTAGSLMGSSFGQTSAGSMTGSLEDPLVVSSSSTGVAVARSRFLLSVKVNPHVMW